MIQVIPETDAITRSTDARAEDGMHEGTCGWCEAEDDRQAAEGAHKNFKLCRVAPGYYVTEGGQYEVYCREGGGWSWNLDSKSSDDVFATKREAVAALRAFISKVQS